MPPNVAVVIPEVLVVTPQKSAGQPGEFDAALAAAQASGAAQSTPAPSPDGVRSAPPAESQIPAADLEESPDAGRIRVENPWPDPAALAALMAFLANPLAAPHVAGAGIPADDRLAAEARLAPTPSASPILSVSPATAVPAAAGASTPVPSATAVTAAASAPASPAAVPAPAAPLRALPDTWRYAPSAGTSARERPVEIASRIPALTPESLSEKGAQSASSPVPAPPRPAPDGAGQAQADAAPHLTRSGRTFQTGSESVSENSAQSASSDAAPHLTRSGRTFQTGSEAGIGPALVQAESPTPWLSQSAAPASGEVPRAEGEAKSSRPLAQVSRGADADAAPPTASEAVMPAGPTSPASGAASRTRDVPPPRPAGAPAPPAAAPEPASGAEKPAARAAPHSGVPAQDIPATPMVVQPANVVDRSPLADSAAPLIEPRLPDAFQPVVMTVRRLAAEGGGEVRLQLQPESLGRVDIRLSFDGAAVRVHLAAETAPTGALLQQRAGDLRAALVESGVAVGQLAVTVGDGREGGRAPAFDAEARASRQPAPRASAPAATEIKTSLVDYRV